MLNIWCCQCAKFDFSSDLAVCNPTCRARNTNGKKLGNDQTLWAEFSSLSDLASLQLTAALLRPSPPPTASHQYPLTFSWINMTNSCTHHTTSFWCFKAIVLLEKLLDYSQNKCICSTPQCEIVSFIIVISSPRNHHSSSLQRSSHKSLSGKKWSVMTSKMLERIRKHQQFGSRFFNWGIGLLWDRAGSILKSRSQYIPGT